MISSEVSTQPEVMVPAELPQHISSPIHKPFRLKMGGLNLMMWACLFLACLGASWFSYQYFLVPQPARFAPNWQGAQWIQAADRDAPVAYFRYVTDLNVLPDSAFVTVAASQVFTLYVNGAFTGSNITDFTHGDFPRAYMYDVASLLRPGSNVIALQVANQDAHTPSVRVSLGIVRGNSIYYYGTGGGWQATAQPILVYPHYTLGLKKISTLWTTVRFDASSWLSAQNAANPPMSPMLTVNPLIYEQPMPTHWMGVGIGHDAYFVRQLSLPGGLTNVWLRLIATGTASIFINGQLFIVWNGQPLVPRQDVARYLSDKETVAQYRTGLVTGVYDIAPYLHPGVNTLAVHVSAPGDSAAQVGLDNLKAAMSLDIFANDSQGGEARLTANGAWRASPQPVDGWMQGSNATLAWAVPILVGRPGVSRTFYIPDSNTPRSMQLIPISLQGEVVLFSTEVILGLWLLVSLLLSRYYRSYRKALEATSLAYLPSVACEGLLVALSREPQIPKPFPYTLLWGLVLIMLVGVSYILLWFNAWTAQRQLHIGISNSARSRTVIFSLRASLRGWLLEFNKATLHRRWLGEYKVLSQLLDRIFAWLRVHWALVLLMLLAIPLISYNLSYEPLWQDELASYYAARGILAHGLPLMPSGFLYTKGELYSYLLAIIMALFGDQVGTLRMISVVEYLIGLPLLYSIGCYFFERRTALLATAMLALSAYSLEWGREVRMYQQAQLLTTLAVYLLYKALQERHRTRLVYLAVGCLVVDYLSHEEIFIILPAIVLWVLVASRDETHRAFAVLHWKRWKHWWYAGAIGAGIIVLQLLLAHFTHPAALGSDESQRPYIQLATDKIPFYIKVLFFPAAVGHGNHGKLPWIIINSLLALAGCCMALRSTDLRAKYCAWFLIISFPTLVIAFSPESDRYMYVILPIYYLIGAYAMLKGLYAIWAFARSRIVLQRSERTATSILSDHLSKPMRVMVTFTISLVCATVLISPILPVTDYNPFISQQAGFSYHRHFPDYDAAGQYMQRHWRQGDIVISTFPAMSVLHFVGHVDYFFSVDKALYLFERDGAITDTPTGSTPLLNQDDLQIVLSTHARIWMILGKGSNQSLVQTRFVFPPDFHMVYEGYGVAIYLRGG